MYTDRSSCDSFSSLNIVFFSSRLPVLRIRSPTRFLLARATSNEHIEKESALSASILYSWDTVCLCVLCIFRLPNLANRSGKKASRYLQLWLAVRIIVWELERQRSLSERRARNAALVLPTSSASSSFCSLRRTSTFDQARLCNPNTTHVVSGNDG